MQIKTRSNALAALCKRAPTPSYRFVSCFSEKAGKGAESYTRRFCTTHATGGRGTRAPRLFSRPPVTPPALSFSPRPRTLQPASMTGHRVSRFFPHAWCFPPRAGTQMVREAKHSTLGARCLWCSGQRGPLACSKKRKPSNDPTRKRGQEGVDRARGGVQNTYKKRAGVCGEVGFGRGGAGTGPPGVGVCISLFFGCVFEGKGTEENVVLVKKKGGSCLGSHR